MRDLKKKKKKKEKNKKKDVRSARQVHIFHVLSVSDMFSILNALLGFFAILTVAAYGSDTMHSLKVAPLLILLAAAADGFDGIIARRVRRGPLGIYIDSLADMISFGVATAIISFLHLVTLSEASGCASAGSDLLYAVVICVYMISGMLRLARFMSSYSAEDDHSAANFFIGFPITGSAIILSSLIFLSQLMKPLHHFILFLSFMCVLSIMMCSRVKYRKIGGRMVIPSVAVGVVVLFISCSYSLSLTYPALVVFIISSAYLCSPFMRISIHRRQQARAPIFNSDNGEK